MENENPEPAQEPKPKRKKTGGRKPILEELELAACLGRYKGNLSACAAHFGVTRTAVSRFLNNHPELQELQRDVKEGLLDNAESALAEAVEAREAWAICFTLKTQGKSRGYIERQEIENVERVSMVVTEEIVDGSQSGNNPDDNPPDSSAV
jgi:predicted transcriptional regulator